MLPGMEAAGDGQCQGWTVPGMDAAGNGGCWGWRLLWVEAAGDGGCWGWMLLGVDAAVDGCCHGAALPAKAQKMAFLFLPSPGWNNSPFSQDPQDLGSL